MIDYYRIRSPLSRGAEEHMSGYIRALGDALGEELHSVGLEQYLKEDFSLLYVASGGSEAFFLEAFERLKTKWCYILTSGESNSLAASMEILSYLNSHGGGGEILHGDIGQVAGQISILYSAYRALSVLRGKKLGCVGAPSDWLIASAYMPDRVLERLGLGFVQIPMEELLSEIAEGRYQDNEYTAQLKRQAFDRSEIEKALHVYGAFRRLTERYLLCGLSVRCFDLLDSVHTTGCLGLALLNSLGIYGGCEGDMPSLLSMAILGSIAGEPVFMCNPSRFDTKNGYAVFAHCTAPLTMLKGYCLNTHFESGIGAAVQGTFEKGDCTLFKCAGDLSRYYVQEGRIRETEYSDRLCRTQISVELDDFSYFLTRPIHNHHIICRGQHAREANAFFRLLGRS